MINTRMNYPIIEQYYTLQGEGFYTGKAAYFIRLAGCDVGCVWCDTKHSWDIKNGKLFSIEQLIQNTKNEKAKLVVITGGEPLMHNLDALTAAFENEHILVNIETSGAHTFSGNWNWVCLSPKKFKLPLQNSYSKANELKIIVSNKHDLIWAQEQSNLVNKDCKLYLQPEFDKLNSMMPDIIDFIKNNPSWQLSLQTHKILNIL
jgi:7-carboxy-7-deazaguanine synthase